MLDAYSRCLRLSRRWQSGNDILQHRRKIYALTRKLRKSGSVGQVEVNDAALALAEAVTGQETLERSLDEALLNLGFFTGASYDAQTTEFEALPAGPDSQTRPEPFLYTSFLYPILKTIISFD